MPWEEEMVDVSLVHSYMWPFTDVGSGTTLRTARKPKKRLDWPNCRPKRRSDRRRTPRRR
jgi:hypothetical protein